FDFVRSLLSILATVAIIYALHEAPSLGWDAPLVLVSLIMGITGVVGFILWEIKHNAPLLDIKLFRGRGLTSGSVSLLTVFWRSGRSVHCTIPIFSRSIGMVRSAFNIGHDANGNPDDDQFGSGSQVGTSNR